MEIEVIDTIKAILVDLGIPQESLHAETSLYADLGLDSVETIKLSLELKRRLAIELKLGNRHDMTLAEICRIANAQESLPANVTAKVN